MFGICRSEYLENIYRFQDSKDPKMHKKLPQFAFYNYKTNTFILEDYNNFESYSDLKIWSIKQLREEEERVKSEKAKRRNSIGCDKKEIDDSNPVKRLDRQRSRSEGSSKTMSDVNTQAAADSIVVNTSNIASNSDSMMHSTTTSQ